MKYINKSHIMAYCYTENVKNMTDNAGILALFSSIFYTRKQI